MLANHGPETGEMGVGDGQWENAGAVGTICGHPAPSCVLCGQCLRRSSKDTKAALAAFLRFALKRSPGSTTTPAQGCRKWPLAQAHSYPGVCFADKSPDCSWGYAHMETCRSLKLKHAWLHCRRINTQYTNRCVFSLSVARVSGNVNETLLHSFP